MLYRFRPSTFSISNFVPQPFDLFGQIPVSEDDLVAWVAAIAPRYLTPERTFRRYVKNWAVADKVRRAKADGTFEQTIKKPGDPWKARLAALNAL